jgi:hypothetical protein
VEVADLIALPRAHLQQVLEALETSQKATQDKFGDLPFMSQSSQKTAAAITALRTALEQPKPPPEAQTEAERLAYCAGWWAAMEQKREQQEQEPVAWLRREELADLQSCNYRQLGADSPRIWAPREADTPTPEQDLVPVYAHPPRREWRGLSEEEIKGYKLCGLVRDVEAKRKEINT